MGRVGFKKAFDFAIRKKGLKDTSEAEYNTVKGEAQAVILALSTWGADVNQLGAAYTTAENLKPRSIAKAFVAMSQVKRDAQSELQGVEAGYREAKRNIVWRLDWMRGHANWEHVRADVEGLAESPAAADDRVTQQRGAEALAMLRQLDQPYLTFELRLRRYAAVKAKQREIEARLREFAMNPAVARHIGTELVDVAHSITQAVGRAAPGQPDYDGALADLQQLHATCDAIKEHADSYQMVLNRKEDTLKKIARIEADQNANTVQNEIDMVRNMMDAALRTADTPRRDYVNAVKSLRAADFECGVIEFRLFEQTIENLSQAEKNKTMKDLFKKRFGVEFTMTNRRRKVPEEGAVEVPREDKNTENDPYRKDTEREVYRAAREMFYLMAQVPESHSVNNPSLKKLKRVGGDWKDSYWQKYNVLGRKAPRVVIKAGRPHEFPEVLQAGLDQTAFPIDQNCQPRDGVNPNQDAFGWATLHEIAHGIDDNTGFMDKNGNALAGWVEYKDGIDPIAEAVAAHFRVNDTVFGRNYVKDLLKGNPALPPPNLTRNDWNECCRNVKAWVESARVKKNPWAAPPTPINGVIYHEAYKNQWVSYPADARRQGIVGYQFRSPTEWLAELYAAYHLNVLRDNHPALKFLMTL